MHNDLPGKLLANNHFCHIRRPSDQSNPVRLRNCFLWYWARDRLLTEQLGQRFPFCISSFLVSYLVCV